MGKVKLPCPIDCLSGISPWDKRKLKVDQARHYGCTIMIHALEKFIGQLKRGKSKLNNAKWFMTNVPWACSKEEVL